MKTLKQAAMQFASDLRNNRCFKAAYNDALLELDREDLNAIVQCTFLFEPKRTLAELDKLIKKIEPRFYVSTSKSIIKALINMHSFEIQLSPIG
ncbi:TPA: hypothetical protein ACPD5P_005294 [Escherichia coli]|nr:hypothetical protein [Salmonella enterica]